MINSNSKEWGATEWGNFVGADIFQTCEVVFFITHLTGSPHFLREEAEATEVEA